MSMSMEKIMAASFGESSSKIRASYKKTVNVKQYETEVIELETVLDVGEKEISGAERMLICAMLQAQLEYSGYCNLAFKGIVTGTELTARKDQLVSGVMTLKEKAEEVTGKSMEHLFSN